MQSANTNLLRSLQSTKLQLRLNSLSGNDVTELKGFKTVSEPVKLVARTLCMFFNTKPSMVTGPDGKTKVADYWEPCKKNILTAALLK